MDLVWRRNATLQNEMLNYCFNPHYALENLLRLEITAKYNALLFFEV
jgi:hypothetical protein